MKKATEEWLRRLQHRARRMFSPKTYQRTTSVETTEDEDIRESVTDAGYYAEVSLRYSSAQMIGIILLAVFLVVSLLTDPSMLSSEHMLFMVKDMAVSLSSREGAARDTLVYTADDDNRYALYRDGLCVLGREELTVFTATGRQAYTDRLAYATPRLDSDGRYLLTYDLGGRDYRLYNSFACVESGQTTAPIRGADAAKDGSYCLITDGVDYASRVAWYDDRFRVIAYYNIEQYTLCADLSANGRELLLASVALQNGRMTTHIEIATRGKTDFSDRFTVEDAYPVAVAWTDEGNVLFLSTDFVACYDTQGRELSRSRFSADDVKFFSLTGEGCVLVCHANAYNADTRVTAFDNKGRMVYNIVTDTRVISACQRAGTLALLTEHDLRLYRPNEDTVAEVIELSGAYDTLLPYTVNELLLCGKGQAVAVRATDTSQ